MPDSIKRWNNRYKQRPRNLFEPDEYLMEKVHLFQQGSVLDVACGDGRNAVYLARQGYDVTGIDFSEEAIRRLDYFASEANVRIHTQVMDVDNAEQFASLGQYENAVIVHFKPSIQSFIAVSKLIRPNGILCMTSFNIHHRITAPDFPEAFCYAEGEFLNKTPQLEVVEYVSYTDKRGSFDGYIFRKR